jgi:transcriptional regulator with PAS, ATPase and Fis domain
MAMQELRAMAARVARGPAKVLITGESGVGKDLIARHIHAHSLRAGRAFVAVNCAGVAETLLESELFGHVKGSFTDAYRDKVGKLQLAHRGTIFLDEIGEMSLRMQALLLRFLENGEIQPVGADTAGGKVDVRVIAATNRALDELIAHGQFREDLLYRIKVVHLHVPPLRDRREDIRPLVDHVVSRAGRSITFSDEAWQALERYHWPGNVRELQNVVERLVWMSPNSLIGVNDLPPTLRQSVGSTEPAVRERRRQIADDLYTALTSGHYSFWEHIHPLFLNRDITRHDLRELIRRGLENSCGNYRAMLKLFGIPERDYKRLLNLLAAHDCTVDYREFRTGRRQSTQVSTPLAVSRPTSPEPSTSHRSTADEGPIPPDPSVQVRTEQPDK